MTFQVGDQVVHPKYGVGYVVKLEEREFEPGVMRPYYEISIPGSTLWVPLDQSMFGLRKLTVRSEIERCRTILAARPLPLTEDSRLRQSDLSTRLKVGTIAVHCEVVRDLSAYGAHRSISGTIAAFLHSTLDVLCQEWSAVEDISLADASLEISILLEQSNLMQTET